MKTKTKVVIFAVLAGFIIYSHFFRAEDKTAPQGVTVAEAEAKSPFFGVAKTDGTVDSRPDDLWELAQDYVFYRNKILIRHKAGDQEGAAAARRDFQQVNKWLSKYPDDKVSAAITEAENAAIAKGR